MQKHVDALTLAETFEERRISPDEEFQAAAGLDAGLAEAWRLADGQWLISCATGDARQCFIVQDLGDLAYYLLDPQLQGAERMLRKAQIFGLDGLAGVVSLDKCMLLIERRYYGPRITVDWARDLAGVPLIFTSRELAHRWAGAYLGGPGAMWGKESSSPQYLIVTAPVLEPK
jgi:hypothetical protein